MKLMQKYVKNDEAIDVNNLLCWSFNFNTVKFLLQITFVVSVIELIKISYNIFLKSWFNMFSIYYWNVTDERKKSWKKLYF